MNLKPPRLAAAALAGLALLAQSGCSGTPAGRDEPAVPPFVFRSLDLRNQDLLGRSTWQLSSPEARYDIRRRLAQAEQPRGVIYRNGVAAYRLSASSGTVINDGEVVLLEGGIRMEQLGPRPMLIRAQRARWYPERNRLEIDRRPVALDPSSRLVARRARFRFDTNLLTLRGQPRLQHWNRRFDPFKDIDRGRPELVLRVRSADWNPNSGVLRTRGPVAGRRRVPGRVKGQPPMTLTASSLEGNTIAETYRLLAPVRVLDPVEAIDLQALDVRLDLRRRLVTSDAPFQGRRGLLQASGQAFEIREAERLAIIPSGCRLLQAGDALRAERCSWNWVTQEVEARGAVELFRQANRQISRGTSLSGRLGPTGALQLNSPGGRVFSRFVVPQRPGPPRLQRPRPAGEPIRL